MSYDPQKNQAIIEARKNDKKQEARETLKKNNTGKNKGQAAQTIKSAKNMINNATPWGLFSIMRQGNILSDWPYALALIAAILKDILDLAEVTGVGYALVIVFTFLCSIFIAMMMMLGGSSGARRQQKIIRSWLILLSGTTAELIFGIDLLPIETLTVCIIYFLMLVDRKEAAEEKSLARNSQEAYTAA